MGGGQWGAFFPPMWWYHGRMRTVVIPDVHQRISWVEGILARESRSDEFVFLGDWFDSWPSSPGAASFEDTCRYLRHLLLSHANKERFVFLVGNHDMPYIYHNSASSRSAVKGGDAYSCSGFTRSKARIFRKVFYEAGLRDAFFSSRFAPAHASQGVICSHAGMSDHHLLPGEVGSSMVSSRLRSVWANFRNFSHPGNSLLSGCGLSRGGADQVGGLLWLDWNAEFVPSSRIGRQIVGHTRVAEPAARALGTSVESWNVDTGRDYAVVQDARIMTRGFQET